MSMGVTVYKERSMSITVSNSALLVIIISDQSEEVVAG